MHGEKVGGSVMMFSRRIETLSEHYKRTFGKQRLFYISKTRFLIKGLCLETKQMWLKSCVARNGDPCLKPRSFSQPQIFFQKFCFHEIRLTDKML